MYIALDIETTGLDPQVHQVLEIAMVADVRQCSVRDCPVFHEIIHPNSDDIIGSPEALLMNQRLLTAMVEGKAVDMDTAMVRLDYWLDDHVPPGRRYLLGKNVGSFDRQFMKRVPRWPDGSFSHRTLDIGSLYAKESGIPGQSELIKQVAQTYAIPGKEHEAVYDARVSLALARSAWGIEF
jgi:oligoribonuclease (3'-5' exoribonuclease)